MSSRLGVYVDAPFRERSDGTLLTNSEAFPFMSFLAELGEGFDGLYVLGRAAAPDAGADYELPPGLALLALPYYTSLRRLRSLAGVVVGTVRAMWRELSRVDVIWVFGPHPLSLALVLMALARRRRVVLGIRQDTMSYFRARLPGPGWAPVLAPLWLLDRAFRLLARRLDTVVVGPQLERAYGGPREGLLAATISLAASTDVLSEPREEQGRELTNLLTVGRIEPEKNPLLVADLLAELNRRRPGFRLRWVGVGRLEPELRAHAQRLGVADSLELPGFVPFGPELIETYRSADAFVHVSLTEGSPQVLVEAMAAGVPVVATDVGSVSAALDDGRAGILVPPDDLDALADAVMRLADDAALRARLANRGLELARDSARDVQAVRVARFVAGPL